MKKLVLLAFVLFLTIPATFGQNHYKTDGVIVPRTITFNSTTLDLNGYGTRSKMWVEVYVQSLYLSKLTQDAASILESNEPMAFRIQVVSSFVSSSKLIKSLDNGIKKSAGKDFKQIQSRVQELKNILTEPLVKNDIFNFYYDPIQETVSVYKNEVLKGKIAGADFKKAFFGIWLSKNPVDPILKDDLLGKY